MQTKNSKKVFHQILLKHGFDFNNPNIKIAKNAFFEFLTFKFEQSEPEFFDGYPDIYDNPSTESIIFQDTLENEFQGLIEYHYFSSSPSHPRLSVSFSRQFSYEQNDDYYGMSVCYLTFSKDIILSKDHSLNIPGKSIWIFDEKDFNNKINSDNNFENFLNIDFTKEDITFGFNLI